MQRNKSSSFFVAGATGYVGRELVRVICESGYSCLAHIRSSGDIERWTRSFSSIGATPLVSTWDAGSIESFVCEHSPSVVFSLLGTTKSRAKKEGVKGDIYRQIDYRLTKILIDACCKQTPQPRFVYLSSVGASLTSRSGYLRSRAQIESELQGSGLSYVSAQPSIITGTDRDEDRPIERLSATVSNGALALAAKLGGKQLQERFRSTSASQLARSLFRLSQSPHEGIASGHLLREL